MNINTNLPIGGVGGILGGKAGTGAVAAPSGDSFSDMFARALNAVNSLQNEAAAGSRALAAGTATNMHDVTIALEKANLALQMTTTVRNKVVEAYQEVMRMTV